MNFTGPIRSGPPDGVVRWSDAGSYRAAVTRPEIRTIVVTKLDHIGDFILGFDALIALREGFPGARIDLICAPWNEAIALATGLFDRVLTLAFFDKRSDGEHPRFDPERMRHLRDDKWDLAIDLRADDDTRIVIRHLDALYRVGFESETHNDALTIAIPHRLPRDYETNIGMHQTFLMLRLVRTVIDLFHRNDAVKDLLLERLAAPAEGVDLARAQGRFLIVCNTSSGREAKNWPIARFARLIGWLANDLGAFVVLLGGKDQISEAADIIAACGAENILSAAGQTSIGQAAWIISQASLFIGNDSGLTHIAARIDVPTLALFSSIDPTATWAPLGEHATVLKSQPVPCAPCHISLARDCRAAHACLTNITEQAVRSAVRRLLASARRYGMPAPPNPERAPKAVRRHYVSGARRNLRKASVVVARPAPAPEVSLLEPFRIVGRAFELLMKDALVGDVADVGAMKSQTREFLSRFTTRMQVALHTVAPDRFESVQADAQFCLVNIDCLRHQHVTEALAFFYPRVIGGGFLIIHNYFSPHWDGISRAVDEFFAARPESVLPTGDDAGAAMIRRLKSDAPFNTMRDRLERAEQIESAPAW